MRLLCKPLHRSVCVKIVRRHHLTLRWVLTLSPLGCDTNKLGSQRRHYPRSSLPAGVSFTGRGLLWPARGSSHEETVGLSGTEPREKTITLKADLFQMTRIHTRQMLLPFCHSVRLPLFPPVLWVRNGSPTSKKPPVNYSMCLF